jgi:hypothetical protein
VLHTATRSYTRTLQRHALTIYHYILRTAPHHSTRCYTSPKDTIKVAAHAVHSLTPCTIHHAPSTIHHTPYTIHHSSYRCRPCRALLDTSHLPPSTIHHSPFHTGAAHAVHSLAAVVVPYVTGLLVDKSPGDVAVAFSVVLGGAALAAAG